MCRRVNLISVSHTCSVFVIFVHLNPHTKGEEKHHLLPVCHTCENRRVCPQHIVLILVSQSFTGCMYHFQTQRANISSTADFSVSFPFPQVNLAIMQKQLSEMAIGQPRQSSSSSCQNGFLGGVGALGIMNNRLAETSVDR